MSKLGNESGNLEEEATLVKYTIFIKLNRKVINILTKANKIVRPNFVPNLFV